VWIPFTHLLAFYKIVCREKFRTENRILKNSDNQEKRGEEPYNIVNFVRIPGGPTRAFQGLFLPPICV